MPEQSTDTAVVSPRRVLELGAVRSFETYPPIVTDFNDPECAIQQNGVDLRLAEAAVARGDTRFTLDKNRTKKCEYHIMQPKDNLFEFIAGYQYALDFMEWVEVPENMMAYIFMRSSINRYAGSLLVGMWDSGFKGRLGAIFRPLVCTTIEVGFRVAQIVFFKAEAARLYSGQYQNQTKLV